jgi:Protein of unknown function with PCYCGC motif
MRRLLVVLAAVLVAGAGLSFAQSAAKQAKPKPTTAASPARFSAPPIPNPGFAPGRPVDVTRAVYEFAGQHPEVLKYVPCYCGCESSGHPHNESCFVKARDAKGNVTAWDTHGYG